MTDIGALTNIWVTKGVRAPQIRSGGLKIWTPSFSDSLVPTKAKTAKKINFSTQVLRELFFLHSTPHYKQCVAYTCSIVVAPTGYELTAWHSDLVPRRRLPPGRVFRLTCRHFEWWRTDTGQTSGMWRWWRGRPSLRSGPIHRPCTSPCPPLNQSSAMSSETRLGNCSNRSLQPCTPKYLLLATAHLWYFDQRRRPTLSLLS